MVVPSYPEEFLDLRDLIMFDISLVDSSLNLKSGNVHLKVCDK